MTTLIVSDSNFNDPNNLIPYLEKDEAITRGVTLGLVDFSNPACYSGSGAISAGAALTNLTSDATPGSFVTAFDAIQNGMLPFSKGIASAQVALPSTMKMLSVASKILCTAWVKVPATGWPTGQSNSIWALLGVMSNSGNQAQFGLALHVSSDGTVDTLYCYVPSSGSSSTGNLTISAGSALSALTDGNLHQLAVVWDARSVPGMQSTTLYVDKVKTATVAPRTYDGTFNIPAAAPALGYSTAFSTAAPHAGLKLGRPGLWNLSNSQLDPVDIITADFSAAQGYVS